MTQGTFALPDDALPPLAYVAPEAPSAAPAAGWDMSGYRLQTLSPTASEAEAAAAAEADELGPDEPIVRPSSSCDSPHSLYRALAVPDRSVLPGQLWVCQVCQRMSTEVGWADTCFFCCRVGTCGLRSRMGRAPTRRPSTRSTFPRLPPVHPTLPDIQARRCAMSTPSQSGSA